MAEPSDQVLTAHSRRAAGREDMGARLRLLRRFFRAFVAEHISALAAAAVAMALYAGSVVALPWLFENLVDTVFVQRDAGALGWLVGVVIVLFAVRAAASFAQQFLLAKVGNRVATDVQRRFADHALGLDLAFFQRNSIGQIVTRGTEDVNVLNQSAVNLLVVMVRDLATLVGLVLYVLWTSPQWFLLALIGGPLIAVPTALATRRIRRLAHRAQELNGELIQAFEEAFHGIRGIKAEGNEAVERRRLGEAVASRRAVQLRSLRLQALLLPTVDLVAAVALVLVLLVGGRSVMSGETEPGRLMAFVAALMLLSDPLRRLTQANALLQNAVASIERIFEVLDMEPLIRDRPGAVTLARPGGDIVLDRVRFGYDPASPVLDGLSVTIPGGGMVAFVGPSGTGKTTILNLVARLNEPQAGRLLVGGQDLAHTTLASLRSAIAFVAQDALLFDAPIRENIAYGKPHALDAEIEGVARLAEADAFIAALPGAYRFRVGPRGARLSGGQRQRLLIARALLRDSPILLLDEPTSALDGDTEARVFRNLAGVRAGRTTIVIAHRLATVAAADLICVLDQGRLAESGGHAALLAHNGPYARAWRLQAGDPERSAG